ncbi:transcription factor grauzone-like [Stomoxys calcitrans]|uniref:transcription factor grauzone-like n=1 Tax=Stomoxys calcitrans TaxID=35570 RepID=UPI0027E2CB45|nr:transcription factor grauzone-like [Stomoxys calcitrans]
MLRQPTPSDYCRLCVKSCNDCQRSLYDETGQANANHDLVSKYFTNAMLNMEWKKRLQNICGEYWQHILEFHQYQECVIEAQKGLHLKEVGDLKFKPEENINQQEIQLELHNTKEFGICTKDLMKPTEELMEWHNAQELSTRPEDLIKPTALSFDIKTEEPLDLNNNSSSDDLPLSSANLFSSVKKVVATKKSVEEFDKLVAFWRSSLKCEICHQLVASYSQLKEHFSKNHASECCYLICCQLRLEYRYDIDRHIRYHNAPQHLKCEACCKAFRSERYLKNHEKKFHTSKGTDKNTKQDSVNRVEGKYRCSKCLKDFETKMRFRNHNRWTGRTYGQPHRRENHACSFCPKAFTWRSSFYQHMKKDHPQEWSKVQRETRYLASEKTHACSFCPKAFKCRAYFCQQEWNNLRGHKGHRRETRGESIVYVCTYCSKEYEKQNAIYRHVKRCQGDYTPIEPKKGYRRETRAESIVYVCIFCSKEHANWTHMHYHLYKFHKDEESLAKKAPVISESPGPAEQQQQHPTHSRGTRIRQVSRIIGPKKTTDVTNKAAVAKILNQLGKEREKKEKDIQLASMEGKELEDATRTKVKTEKFSADTNALEN